MFSIFVNLLNMSITASILAIVVVLLRLFLKKVPRKYICILWALVALRLILPISFSSPASVFNAFPQATDSKGQVEYFQYNEKSEKPAIVLEIPALVNDNYSPDSMTVGTKSKSIYMPPVLIIWATGVGIMVLYSFVSYFRLKKQIKASVKTEGNIYVCDDIVSPFILGIIRPRIYLPTRISEDVKNNVIAHEKAHVKRLDFIWKPLGFFLLSIYWFNPIMWISYILLCKDIEAACDERVIAGMDKSGIVGYSEALLSCAVHRRLILACPIAFGETDVKGRIKNVLNYRKPAFWIICISIIVCVVVGICFLTNPKKSGAGLLDKASPETSALAFKYFDGEKTEVKWLYEEKEEEKIIDEINSLTFVKVGNDRQAELGVPCYGLEISDKSGYMIWLTYGNGLWLSKDGSVYEAEYDFEQLYNRVSGRDLETMQSGIGMTNAGILGEYDIRYYKQAAALSYEKNGVSLSISKAEEYKVYISIKNDSGETFTYGTDYSLQKEISGVWYQIPSKVSNYAFTLIGYEMPAGEIAELECDLSMYRELSDGHYRIVKADMAAEFLVKDSKALCMPKESESNAAGEADNNGMETDSEDEQADDGLTRSEYTYELIFNFGGYYFLADKFTEPKHGKDASQGWYALGGEGECLDPSAANFETFVNGKLTDYEWLDNHSDRKKIFSFSVGKYSGCLYRYSFDLFTATEIKDNPNTKSISEYWVVFFTEGEEMPLRLKYFNCDYFTKDQAVESVASGAEIVYGFGKDEENLGIFYREHPITHEYQIAGDIVFKYKKSLIGKDAKAIHSLQFIVLTNDEDITWEKVYKSLYSSDSADWLQETVIIGMNSLD